MCMLLTGYMYMNLYHVYIYIYKIETLKKRILCQIANDDDENVYIEEQNLVTDVWLTI